MKGYKIFDGDWTCRGLQYAPDMTTAVKGQPEICVWGLHFCKRAVDCLNYYEYCEGNRYAEVWADGTIVTGDDKCATNMLTVVRELTYEEFGKLCTGVTLSHTPLGQPHIETSWRNGLRQGKCTVWRDDGQIGCVGQFVNDTREGVWTEYNTDGTITTSNWDNGIRI